jgi:anhydro-N-acetylmuramic acid kinase
MSKLYYSLGLMSGTSMDGVDASIIQSDGETRYKLILDKYFEYPQVIYKNLTRLRDKIKNHKDLEEFSKEIQSVEKEITLFHANAVKQILKETKINLNIIGFHGQTIYHNSKEKISKQLGDGELLSKLTKKIVINKFRQNDLKNEGQGAPLTPIFHKLLAEQNKINLPVIFINLGGITNYTFIYNRKESKEKFLISADAGPGNCLVDQWVREKLNKKYDEEGKIASLGKIDEEILAKVLDNSLVKKSYDIKDFDLSPFQKLSLEDGAATLAEYTAVSIKLNLLDYLENVDWNKSIHVLISGGGRKNNFLINRIKKNIKKPVKLIDDLKINGDFVESQAFAYIAIRSYLKLPISFPSTTGVKKPCTGGKIFKN